MKLRTFLLVFFVVTIGAAQEDNETQVLDSLERILNSSTTHDTAKVAAYSEAAEVLYYRNQDTLLPLSVAQENLVNKALEEYETPEVVEKLKKHLANAYNNRGVYYGDNADIDKSLDFYFKSLKIHEEIDDPEGKGSTVNNIAFAFENRGDVTRALEYYNKSLVIRERSGDLEGKAITLYNIAYIYSNQNETKQALKYFKWSLEIEDSLGSDIGKAYCYNSIGEIYTQANKTVKAKKYLDSAFTIRKRIDDQLGLAQTYENYAEIHLKRKSYALALANYKKALSIRETAGQRSHLCFNLYNIGLTFLKVNKLDSAMHYAQRSKKIAKEINYPASLRNVAELYSKIYERKGETKKAFTYYKKYIWLRDSLSNAETQRAAIQREAQYNYERKLTEDSIRYENQAIINDAMIDKKNAELEARRNQQYLLFGGLSLSVIFGLVVYNRFRITRKQNNIIDIQRETAEMQRKVVETKNKEITDSINYAKRIQEAILPSRDDLTQNLKNGFVLFRPKDVVSGDFYWLEKANGYIFFAAADCTGHGVPGAMVSVVCSNALTKGVLEENITDPGKLLDRTKEIVIERLNKSGESVNDGMDISLVVIKEEDWGKDKLSLQWSGANNGIWIIRSGKEKVETIKADKQPVGVQQEAKSFTTKNITVQQGDQIYLFTDGFVDQFGGEYLDGIPKGGKKYKSRRFKELLLKHKNEAMDVQQKRMETEFETWMGDLEQVDDVCVIGIRF